MSTKQHKFMALKKKEVDQMLAKHSKPDLFITYTPKQNFESTPDVCSLKFQKEFTKIQKLIGATPRIEFQKRGPPCMHIMLFSPQSLKKFNKQTVHAHPKMWSDISLQDPTKCLEEETESKKN